VRSSGRGPDAAGRGACVRHNIDSSLFLSLVQQILSGRANSGQFEFDVDTRTGDAGEGAADGDGGGGTGAELVLDVAVAFVCSCQYSVLIEKESEIGGLATIIWERPPDTAFVTTVATLLCEGGADPLLPIDS
jgi:hypothetical protein